MSKKVTAPPSSSDLAENIAALTARRDEIAGRVDEMQAALDRLQAQLVEGGSATPADIAAAHNELQAARSTLAYVEAQIQRREGERVDALRDEARRPHYEALQTAGADIDDLAREFNETVRGAVERLANDIRVIAEIRQHWQDASKEAGAAWDALGGRWYAVPVSSRVSRTERGQDLNIALMDQLDAAGVEYAAALLSPPETHPDTGPKDSMRGPRRPAGIPFEADRFVLLLISPGEIGGASPDAATISRRVWTTIAAGDLPGVAKEVQPDE